MATISDPSRLFADTLSLAARAVPEREQPAVCALEPCGIERDTVLLSARFADGSRTELRIAALACDEPAWLVQLGRGSRHDLHLDAPRLRLASERCGDALLLEASAGAALRLALDSGDLAVTAASELRVAGLGPELMVGDGIAAAPLFRHAAGFGVCLGLRHGERIYGGGEHFGPMVKNGSVLDFCNSDALGVGGRPQYHSVPYLWSSAGYGLALLDAAPSRLDLASRHDVLRWLATGPGLSLLIQPAASPRAAVAEFRRRSQRLRGVPDWSSALWLSRCYYQNGAEVDAAVDGARARGIDRGVVNLDARCWMRAETRTDFVWDESRLPPAGRFLPDLRARGFEVCLWENPYVSSAAALHAEGCRRGFFATTAAGEPYPLVWVPAGMPGFPQPPPAGLVDFTNPEARAWWKDLHRPYLRAGVRCFKTDFGEEIPADARFADGSDGWTVRNAYADLYNQCVTEVLAEECGEDGIVWARSGWFRAASTPVKWAGDSQTSFRALRATLRAGLGQAVAGALFWSHDTGGFYGPPPAAELYLRWAQLAMWNSHVRCHGTTPREPWLFGDTAWQGFARALQQRQQLRAYFLASYRQCVAEAQSFVRPLWLDWPADPACALVDDQFMAGPDILVAPFLESVGGRSLYLPAGDWRDLRDGRCITGERHLYTGRSDAAPAFVRRGSPAEPLLR
jgi:alpha-D-xyloside xylohydrolase